MADTETKVDKQLQHQLDVVKEVGRDAADVSFMTVFGDARFGDKVVTVSKTA